MHSGSAEPVASRKKCNGDDAKLNVSIRAADWLPGDAAAAHQERELIQQLAVGITHNLNNLLTSVMCGSGMALDSLTPDHPARAPLETALQAAERATILVKQIMAYAGIRLTPLSAVDLSSLAALAVARLGDIIPRRVQLRLDLLQGLTLYYADRHQLEQTIQALVWNAVEAIGEAEGVVSVRTFAGEICDPPGRPGPVACVGLEVSDTGCGMDARILGQIFEPFFSTKSLGRGLSLAAVAGIVRAHGGAVHVESTPGAGTTFRVLLPVCAHPEA